MTTSSPISILDLTVAQTETIEKEIGLPMTRWSEAPSMAQLFSAILSAVEGNSRAFYAGLTMRDLAARVNLGEDEEDSAPND